MTYADLGGLGPLSEQVVLVGDPGQIAPVVTGDSRRWQDWSAGPQRAAPEALIAAYPDAVTRLRLPHTWRLGPLTTSLIQPAFYTEMPFTSARPPRQLVLGDAVLPELEVQRVTAPSGPGDPSIASAAASRVHALLEHGAVIDDTGSGHCLHPQDVAVITPHVEQASAISARLAPTPGVTIGTANQLQGLEREAVVVVHPLAGPDASHVQVALFPAPDLPPLGTIAGTLGRAHHLVLHGPDASHVQVALFPAPDLPPLGTIAGTLGRAHHLVLQGRSYRQFQRPDRAARGRVAQTPCVLAAKHYQVVE
jgi:hypothetical protein